MNIVETSRELTPFEIYNMTLSPEAESMKNASGKALKVSAWLTYEDADKKTGETINILTISDGFTGRSYGAQSETFKRSFHDIIDIAKKSGMDEIYIKVITGLTKAGREYINCVLITKEVAEGLK